QAAGGYRKYYDGTREGTLQGGGTAGGLGLDAEFFESVLVPQIMIDGFLGFKPGVDGFTVNPRLPSDWPELMIDRIHWHDRVLTIRATKDSVEIREEGKKPVVMKPPAFVK
ncbi:MAG TPA: glycosyl hydrolase family 65 protein, partial [Armatimonadota bacterium]|nr:glycosyl hydrolase family 65 protein [Armatimonadota bacterium]